MKLRWVFSRITLLYFHLSMHFITRNHRHRGREYQDTEIQDSILIFQISIFTTYMWCNECLKILQIFFSCLLLQYSIKISYCWCSFKYFLCIYKHIYKEFKLIYQCSINSLFEFISTLILEKKNIKLSCIFSWNLCFCNLKKINIYTI